MTDFWLFFLFSLIWNGPSRFWIMRMNWFQWVPVYKFIVATSVKHANTFSVSQNPRKVQTHFLFEEFCSFDFHGYSLNFGRFYKSLNLTFKRLTSINKLSCQNWQKGIPNYVKRSGGKLDIISDTCQNLKKKLWVSLNAGILE